MPAMAQPGTKHDLKKVVMHELKDVVAVPTMTDAEFTTMKKYVEKNHTPDVWELMTELYKTYKVYFKFDTTWHDPAYHYLAVCFRKQETIYCNFILELHASKPKSLLEELKDVLKCFNSAKTAYKSACKKPGLSKADMFYPEEDIKKEEEVVDLIQDDEETEKEEKENKEEKEREFRDIGAKECKLLQTSTSWFNDNIINSWFEHLGRIYSNVGYISSFARIGDLAFEKYLKRAKKGDFDKKNIILAPVHVRGDHWTLAVMDLKQNAIFYIDSMTYPRDAQKNIVFHNCSKFMIDVLEMKSEPSKKEIKSQQQDNCHDCGPFVCYNAQQYCYKTTRYIGIGDYLVPNEEIVRMSVFRKKMYSILCADV